MAVLVAVLVAEGMGALLVLVVVVDVVSIFVPFLILPWSGGEEEDEEEAEEEEEEKEEEFTGTVEEEKVFGVLVLSLSLCKSTTQNIPLKYLTNKIIGRQNCGTEGPVLLSRQWSMHGLFLFLFLVVKFDFNPKRVIGIYKSGKKNEEKKEIKMLKKRNEINKINWSA